mgnify:CR=1 FL=1
MGYGAMGTLWPRARFSTYDLTDHDLHAVSMRQSSLFLGDVLHAGQLTAKELFTMNAKLFGIPRTQQAELPLSRLGESRMPCQPVDEPPCHVRARVEHLDPWSHGFLKCRQQQGIMRAGQHQHIDILESIDIALHRQPGDIRIGPAFFHDRREKRSGVTCYPVWA